MSVRAASIAGLALVLTAGCRCAATHPRIDPPPPDVPDAALEPEDAGDACAGGLGPGTPVASGLNVPRRLASDGEWLFVSEAGSHTAPDGRVLRLPLAGGLLDPLATGLQSPDALAADEGSVYVLDSDGLWRIDKGNGQRTLLEPTLSANVAGQTELRTSGDQIVVATGLRWLIRLERNGLGRAVLYEGPSGAAVRSAAIDGDRVFFLVAGPAEGLYEVPLDGSSPPRLLQATSGGRSLAVSAERFVWTEDGVGGGRVRTLLRQPGAEPVEVAAGLSAPAHPVIVGPFVYFTEATAGAESEMFLQRALLCAPGEATPVGPAGIGPGGVLAQGGVVFFTSAQTAPLGQLGRLP